MHCKHMQFRACTGLICTGMLCLAVWSACLNVLSRLAGMPQYAVETHAMREYAVDIVP